MNDPIAKADQQSEPVSASYASQKEKRKAYKQAAREKAAAWLKEKKTLKGKEKRAFKKERKKAVKEWKKSLSGLDRTEKRDQKRAYKAYKKRLKRTGRCIRWGILALALCCLIYFGGPTFSMALGVLGSQRYSDKGPEADAVRAAGMELSALICDEGYILMKNDRRMLPLPSGAKVNIFGDDAYNFVYGGSGSAGADQSDATSIFEAFDLIGIEYNKELDKQYYPLLHEVDSGKGSTLEMVTAFFLGAAGKTDWSMPTDEMFTQALDYSDTALIVLSSQEVEGNELRLSTLQPMAGDTVKAQLIDKVCRSFEKVILVVNSGNAMELGFVNDYDADIAVVWVGAPGAQGCIELARVLNGEVNPSGKTVDTWPVSIEAEPSYINYGDNAYVNDDMHVFTYDEGIYVGYRYYETRFGLDEQAYAANVVFPFGYGLSYTEFEQKLLSVNFDDETVTAEVEIKNIGSVAGKDVVELYFMPPWYETSGIEKSAIELGAFAKTELLAPGTAQTLTLSFPIRDMASWSTAEGCYLLEKGEYRIVLGTDVHSALTEEENTAVYTVASNVVYRTDETTGVALQNLFGFAEGDVRYLSRADWEGTFPAKVETYTLSAQAMADREVYERGETGVTAAPTTGAKNGIVLSDLKGLAYDDPKWELFLDQFTEKEMMRLMTNGGWHTVAIKRLGIPSTRLLDGPSGINSMFTSLNAVAYPMETVISSSWNVEMARLLGEAIGNEANVYGLNGWYGPAMNTHRSSIGGRNSEYYSEDPLLAGKMAAASIEAIQSKHVIAFMKHFVCNDLEKNARGNVSIWVSEQALREIYLRPFEYAVKEGGAGGAMSSFSRLGVKWCGGSSELMGDLLRTEWGFQGVVTTDACLGSWMDAGLAAKNGNDLMLEMGLQQSMKVIRGEYKADPIGITFGLRNSVHNICYAIVNYTDLCD